MLRRVLRTKEIKVTTIVGISGSLRRDSFNTLLLKNAAACMPNESELRIEGIEGIPLFNEDIETNGLPPRVVELKEIITNADGLILATPEYNHSIPGVFKNALDWLSRPPSDIKRVFGAKPVGITGATQAGLGTMASQNAWLPILRSLGTRPWFGGWLLVSDAQSVFNKEGVVESEKVRSQVEQFMRGFVAFADEETNRRQSK